MNPLLLAARFGPYVLIAGLVVGLAAPSLAQVLSPYMPQLVAVLLFVSVLRIAPQDILGSLSDLPGTVGVVLIMQMITPLTVLGIGSALGLGSSPYLLALILMTAAPSIVGSPNICLMMGVQPGHALRLMVLGTALLPVTVVPVFWWVPGLGEISVVLFAALRLFLVILGVTALAVLVRHWVLRNPSERTKAQMDGASAIALAVFVIGLMPSVSAAASANPGTALGWLGLACLANFGAQIGLYRITRTRMPADRAVPLSVIAGNRNIALYFVSLPSEVIAPLLVFIGCYQIPMYLTPLVMRRFYRSGPPSEEDV